MTRARAAGVAGVALAALVALGLGCGSEAPVNAETRARDEFIHALAEREGLADVWPLVSRAELVFEDGWSTAQMIDPGPSVHWSEVSRVYGSTHALAVRWLGPSGHLRVRGHGDTRLQIWGRLNLSALFTRPRVTATFDGLEIYSRVVADDGVFEITAVIPGAWLDGWSDVYVNLSSVSEPWREPGNLRIARIEGVLWQPVP